jgi:hypothetical protein
MKRAVSALAIAMFAAAASVGAQQGPPPVPAVSPPAPTSAPVGQAKPAASQGAGNKIVVTGCVETAAAPGAADGASGRAAEMPRFVLANARLGTEGAPTSTGAVGTSGTLDTRYELDGEEKDLSGHLNQQVEISGTLDASATSGAGAAGVRATPKLKVDRVKMVAAVCSKP